MIAINPHIENYRIMEVRKKTVEPVNSIDYRNIKKLGEDSEDFVVAIRKETGNIVDVTI